MPKPKNIVFILVDALRADRLGFMGYSRPTSPALDSLAKEGAVFSRFYAQSGWTLPSVASFFTGKLPAFHRVENYQDVLHPDDLTIAEFLESNGYKTVGFSTNPIISKDAGFAKGFDRWKNIDYDDCITRRAVSFLDPAIPTVEELERDNLFDYNAFRYLYINRKRSHGVKPGYFEKGRLEIKPEDISHSRDIIATETMKEIEPGEYVWGFSLSADTLERKVKMALETRDGKSLKVLSEKLINIPETWQLFSFKLRIPMKTAVRLRLTIEGRDTIPKGSLYFDTPFLFRDVRKNREPVFIYLHYMEVHEPNKISRHLEKGYLGRFTGNLLKDGNVDEPPGDPFGITNCRTLFPVWQEENNSINWHNNRYDETILFIDDQVKMLVDALKRAGSLDDSLIIFTSDHGQEFFDHGWTSHGYSLYNELLHIPFLMYFPKCFPRGLTIDLRAQSIDLFSTLMEMIKSDDRTGSDTSEQTGRISLLPCLFQHKYDKRETAVFSSDARARLYSLITGEWKYILKDSGCLHRDLLFNLEQDASEKRDLSTSIPERDLLETMRRKMASYNKLAANYQKHRARKTLPPDKLNTDKLVQLGYINPHYVTQVGQDIDCSVLVLKVTLLGCYIVNLI